MGSCISKCKPKKRFNEDLSHVHDKLVITQDDPIPSIPNTNTLPKKQKPPSFSPAPSCNSTASFSSFTSSTNSKVTIDSSISSSSSCSSSVLSSKDRSFSNEFLLHCMKENPHIIGLKPMIKEKIIANKIHPQNLELPSPLVPQIKKSIQEKSMISVGTPKKRTRSNSPSIARQKSFRKEQNSSCSTPNRGLRSPSPSRRFSGENNRSFVTDVTNESSCRRSVSSKGSGIRSMSSGAKMESFRAPLSSSNRDLVIKRHVSIRKKDGFYQQVGKKIDGVGVGDVQCRQETDAVMEDVNNPLIALDCFIFL